MTPNRAKLIKPRNPPRRPQRECRPRPPRTTPRPRPVPPLRLECPTAVDPPDQASPRGRESRGPAAREPLSLLLGGEVWIVRNQLGNRSVVGPAVDPIPDGFADRDT